MGTEGTQNGIKSKEILQTEYNSTPYDKSYNINFKYDIKALNKNSKNNQKKVFFNKKKKIINKPKSLTNIFLMEEKKKNNNNYFTKANQKEKRIVVKDNLSSLNKKLINNNIHFDYFKCISCPMCILIQINPKNNRVKIKCENGHVNEMNIDSFNSIYQVFKYTCDKCKKELSSKFYYCSKCKEIFCDTCMKKNLNIEINKGHIFLDETEVNLYCEKHKKKFINFCKNCQKNLCKKCCSEHNTHELLLIKNEIRDDNNISRIEKMVIKEKEIIDQIEQKYPLAIFKNQNNFLKTFNRLISLRKKEYYLKDKILKIYQDCIQKLNTNLNDNKSNENSDNTITSISSTISIGEYPNNFLMNYYFLKSLSELENEVLSNINDFFDISEDNKFYKDFSELKIFLNNYKKNVLDEKKNLENFSKLYTIHKKPNYIFPLDDGNFIVTYDTKIIFYDGLYGDELLIIDEEIFDYTYKIIKLQDETLLFFGDFLNQIKIETNGNIKVLFTGSHVEILKEIILDENNLIFIDKITQKLKILTNRDINWHKEIFPEYNINNKNLKEEEKYELNNSMMIDSNKENNLNNSFMTMNEFNNAEKLFMNSIKNMRENKKNKINEIIKDTKNINNQIKTFDIVSLNETNFITFQEKNFISKETCLRIFFYDKNNFKFNITEEIYLEEIPLKKNDVLYLIKNEKEEDNYIGYGTNNKKYFIVFNLDKKIIIAKLNMNFISFKFFGNILLYQYQNELIQYVFKEDEFIFISKLPFDNVIHSINFLKDFSLVLDDKKFTYVYSYKKENI